MKEIIIIIIILTIIIVGGMCIQKYLEKSSKELIEDLSELKGLIEIKENPEKIVNKAEEIYYKWGETEEFWAIIVVHSELDLIDIALIEMKSDIEVGNLEKSTPELEKAIFLINHINEKEKFTLKNIF